MKSDFESFWQCLSEISGVYITKKPETIGPRQRKVSIENNNILFSMDESVSAKDFVRVKNSLFHLIQLSDKSQNLHIITFNLLFLYYLSWCNIKDITFLEDLQNKLNQKKIKISSFVVRRLHIKLNNNHFKEYKRLQYILYHHNFIHI